MGHVAATAAGNAHFGQESRSLSSNVTPAPAKPRRRDSRKETGRPAAHHNDPSRLIHAKVAEPLDKSLPKRGTGKRLVLYRARERGSPKRSGFA